MYVSPLETFGLSFQIADVCFDDGAKINSSIKSRMANLLANTNPQNLFANAPKVKLDLFSIIWDAKNLDLTTP